MAKNKATRAEISGIERRAYPVKLEVRAGTTAGVSTIEGYASVVETGYEMWDWYGPYTEIVRSGAFTRTLNANPQVQLLLNHGGLSMAYTKAGTLRLSEDTTGLHMAADVNTTRGDVRDMLAAIEDGAVDEMSFAFRTTRQQWSPDYDQRDILEVDIHRGDVSVVNFGANPATSVSARSADLIDHLSRAGALALQRRLEERLKVVVVDTDEDDDQGEGDVACPECSAPNESNAKFCKMCGSPMASETDSQTQAPASLYLALAQSTALTTA